MIVDRITTMLIIVVALAGCSKTTEPPKPTTAPAASTAMPSEYAVAPAADAGKMEAKSETKPDVPDTHGMPGMSDLFKDDKGKESAKK